jgi:Flp pilus assembly protein TadG
MGRRCRGDRGEVLSAAIVMPVVLVAVLLVVQFGLAFHARRVLAGATQDAAVAAARADGSPGEGEAVARQLIAGSAGPLLDGWTVSTGADGDRVTVTATGHVDWFLPFLGSITVRASSSAPIEKFRPEGASP